MDEARKDEVSNLSLPDHCLLILGRWRVTKGWVASGRRHVSHFVWGNTSQRRRLFDAEVECRNRSIEISRQHFNGFERRAESGKGDGGVPATCMWVQPQASAEYPTDLSFKEAEKKLQACPPATACCLAGTFSDKRSRSSWCIGGDTGTKPSPTRGSWVPSTKPILSRGVTGRLPDAFLAFHRF